MAHNTVLSSAVGTGDTIVDVDLSLATYPTTGKLPASCIFVSANATTAPTPVTAANALYVQPGTSTTWAATQSGTWNVGTVTTVTTVATVTTITNVVHVDDNSGSLTVDAPVGTPVFVRLSDGASAITTLAVSLASVPSHAVTNAGTFVVQENGAALTALQLIDDAIYADDGSWTGDTSKHALVGGLYQSTPQTVTDGKVAPFEIDVNGNLKVAVQGTLTVASHAVTNAGTFAVQAAQSGTWNITNVSGTVSLPTGASTSAKQDTQITAEQAIQVAVEIMDDWDETNRCAVNIIAGQVGVVGGSGTVSALTQRVVLATDVALPAGTNAIGKLAANSGVDIGDVDVTSIAAGDNNIGNVDIVTVPSDPFGANADAASATGSISAKLRFIAGTGIPITGTVTVGSHAVTNAGTFVVQIDGAALTSLQLIDDAVSGAGFNITQMNGVNVTMGNGASGTGVQRVTVANDSTGILAGVTTVTTVTTVSTLTGGNIAHDSGDSGNPHKIGAKATASVLGETPVAANDRTNLFAGTDGVLITRQGTSLEDIISENSSNTDGASTAMTGAFAATASQRIYLTDITIANSSATNVTVNIRDGAAGAVLWTFPVPATGGVTHRFGTPLRFTANTALAYDASAGVTTVYCSVCGFKSKA